MRMISSLELFGINMLLWGLNGVSKIPKTHNGAASYGNSKVYQPVNIFKYSIKLSNTVPSYKNNASHI